MHKTTSHDDAECYTMRVSRPPKKDDAHIAADGLSVSDITSPPRPESPSDFDNMFAFTGL